MKETLSIKDHLGPIVDPSNNQTLEENQAIRYINVDEDNVVQLIIGVYQLDDQSKKTLNRAIAKVIKLDLGFQGLKIEFEPLKKVTSVLNEEKNIVYIGVASGKGGVGKSTVAVNLAVALTRLGKRTAIIDADIYGSSVPQLMNVAIETPSADEQEKIIPFKNYDVELISTAFFLQPDQPIMWRGPMLGKMLNHFFYDVAWHEDTEFIVIDLPPGTGDVAMDIQKLIPQCHMLIVTTPHHSASNIAVKAGFGAKQLEHPILGVVENLAGIPSPNGLNPIFGEGGGETVANKLKTQVLSQIPIELPKMPETGVYEMNEPNGVAFLGLANKLLKHFSN